MPPDTAPDALRSVLDTWRAEPQPPIPWPRDRWLQGLPDHADAVRALPEALDRDTVRRACRDAARDRASATSAFVAVMVWGFGSVGFGPHRTRLALATHDAGGRLLKAAQALADEGPLAAYLRLARPDDCKLDRLGPAFATKYLYFCQPRPADTVALILDDLVAFWLDCKITFRLEPATWSERTYSRYLDQMQAWADALGCAPDDLERSMFMAEATRRGGQWAVVPSDSSG